VQCGASITEDEALEAEDARYAAQIGNNFVALARLFADDLVYLHSSGAVDGKDSFIARLRSNALRCRSMAGATSRCAFTDASPSSPAPAISTSPSTLGTASLASSSTASG
jgi:Domain of unknown function (DUF4440)